MICRDDVDTKLIIIRIRHNTRERERKASALGWNQNGVASAVLWEGQIAHIIYDVKIEVLFYFQSCDWVW